MFLSDAKASKRFNLGRGWQDGLIVSPSVSKPSVFDSHLMFTGLWPKKIWALAPGNEKTCQKELEKQVPPLILHEETSLRRKVGSPCNCWLPDTLLGVHIFAYWAQSILSLLVFAERILCGKLWVHRGKQEWAVCTPIRCFWPAAVVQWPWCEQWLQFPHTQPLVTLSKQAVGAAARPYQRQEKQSAFCWEVRQTRQVFWLKTQPAKVREHRSVSLFFFFFYS